MAVKSVFDIKCFKDVKFWGGGGGGEDVQQPKNPGPKHFYQIRN